MGTRYSGDWGTCMARLAKGDFGTWAEYYSAYQRALAKRFLMPFLRESGVTHEGRRVLDLGCGDGGCTAAFAEDAASCVGVDIDEFPWPQRPNLEFVQGDVLDPELANTLSGRFDLVLIRDVIEHVEDKPTLMEHAIGALDGSGHILITFPPYYSPFGAHQQVELRESSVRYAPYMHAHPGLRHIARTRMTIGAFERLVPGAGAEIVARRLFVSRPSFELRYGIPVVRFPFPWFRGLREVICSGAYYLLAAGR
ncbi:MAG: methyltransferase domain-containing protein [Candidatus Eisenbacteria bacterium]|nr:methyltransferase domain-containing protein [Candidatus Eisenbacteria bacterium]